MITQPQRLQYLEAMGISAWSSRYRFANAKATELCEWVVPEVSQKAPNERLHALLETSAQDFHTEASNSELKTSPERGVRGLSQVRGLLGLSPANAQSDSLETPAASSALNQTASTQSPETKPESSEPLSAEKRVEPAENLYEVEKTSSATIVSASSEKQPPLRFTLSLALLGSNTWLLLPDTDFSAEAAQLLKNMFAAANLPASWETVATLQWPLIKSPSTDPKGEAQEGIRVFCEGQAKRNQLSIDHLIIVGDAVWADLIDQDKANLTWQLHRLPNPQLCLTDFAQKRTLWPVLHQLGQALQS